MQYSGYIDQSVLSKYLLQSLPILKNGLNFNFLHVDSMFDIKALIYFNPNKAGLFEGSVFISSNRLFNNCIKLYCD